MSDKKVNHEELTSTSKMVIDAYEKWNSNTEGGEDDLHYAVRQLKDLLGYEGEADETGETPTE